MPHGRFVPSPMEDWILGPGEKRRKTQHDLQEMDIAIRNTATDQIDYRRFWPTSCTSNNRPRAACKLCISMGWECHCRTELQVRPQVQPIAGAGAGAIDRVILAAVDERVKTSLARALADCTDGLRKSIQELQDRVKTQRDDLKHEAEQRKKLERKVDAVHALGKQINEQKSALAVQALNHQALTDAVKQLEANFTEAIKDIQVLQSKCTNPTDDDDKIEQTHKLANEVATQVRKHADDMAGLRERLNAEEDKRVDLEAKVDQKGKEIAKIVDELERRDAECVAKKHSFRLQ